MRAAGSFEIWGRSSVRRGGARRGQVVRPNSIGEIWATTVWAASGLFTGKLALARNALVRFGKALDPIFKLAVPLGQLFGHHIAAFGSAPLHGPCGEPHSLACSKLVLRWWVAFRAHARLSHGKASPSKARIAGPDHDSNPSEWTGTA